MSPRWEHAIGSGSKVGLALCVALWLGPAVSGQGLGPDLPPGFYGLAPDPFPGPQAPAGVRRLALVYTGCIIGETEPCG